MTIRAYGDKAAIELFEHHLVITRRRPGFIVDGPPAEQFIPFSSIKSVQFIRPGLVSLGKIVLSMAGGSNSSSDECIVLFHKGQLRQFENVLRTVRQAIATPSIEHLAMMASERRERIVESQPSSDQGGQEIITPQLQNSDGAKDQDSYRTGKHEHLGTARQQQNNDKPFKYTLSVW